MLRVILRRLDEAQEEVPLALCLMFWQFFSRVNDSKHITMLMLMGNWISRSMFNVIQFFSPLSIFCFVVSLLRCIIFPQPASEWENVRSAREKSASKEVHSSTRWDLSFCWRQKLSLSRATMKSLRNVLESRQCLIHSHTHGFIYRNNFTAQNRHTKKTHLIIKNVN